MQHESKEAKEVPRNIRSNHRTWTPARRGVYLHVRPRNSTIDLNHSYRAPTLSIQSMPMLGSRIAD